MADSHIAMVSSAKSRSVNASISFGIEEAILRSPARGEGSISDRAATEQESSGRISLHERAQAIDRRIPLIGNPVETDPDVGETLRFPLPATQIGRAEGRERVCQSGSISADGGTLQKQ